MSNYETTKKSKRRAFVRPNCNKVWCFQCQVCIKKHYKYAAHALCYRKWCDICQFAYDSEEVMKNHALLYHPNEFCEICNQVFNKLKIHKNCASHKANIITFMKNTLNTENNVREL